MILVTTAGKIGAESARQLAAAGQAVRVMSRHPERLGELSDTGVQVVGGDLDDPASVRAALVDVEQVVLVSPAVPAQEIGVVEAATEAAVTHVVKVTSKASADSPIERRRGQVLIEQALANSGLAYTLLRANALMQNLLVLAPVIEATGGFASSVGAGRVGMVDSRDVAAVAAVIAAAPAQHVGHTYWLSGPTLVDYDDVAAAFSKTLGRTITYTPRTQAEDEAAMVAAGVPPAVAAQNAQAFALTAQGDAEWLSQDVATLLGRPPRTVQQFVDDHAAAFA